MRRTSSSGDAILGMSPAAVYEPCDGAQAAAAMEEAARESLTLAFAGGRTAIEIGAPPRRLDAVVDMRKMACVLEHVPADQIVVAEAGVTLAGLQQALAPHGQRLALDPPRPDRATLGGIVASNAFGPLRTRYGSVRDLLIGVSFVRADGVPVRAGGKVVKNVAGFDVAKLLTGSLGTLGLVTSATFRLHPLPEDRATILWEGRSASDVAGLAGRIGAASLEPASVFAVSAANGPARWDVAVRFEGFSAGVAQQQDRLLALLAGSRVADARADAAFSNRHDTVRGGAPVSVKLAAPRSAFERVASDALAPVLEALEGAAAVWYPTLGLGFVSGRAPDPSAAAEAIAAARRTVRELGGSLVVEAAPRGVRGAVDVWGPPPASLSVMEAIKQRLDPGGRLAPGRFAGGI